MILSAADALPTCGERGVKCGGKCDVKCGEWGTGSTMSQTSYSIRNKEDGTEGIGIQTWKLENVGEDASWPALFIPEETSVPNVACT